MVTPTRSSAGCAASVEWGCPHPRWQLAGEIGVLGCAEGPGTTRRRIPFQGSVADGTELQRAAHRATGEPTCREGRWGTGTSLPDIGGWDRAEAQDLSERKGDPGYGGRGLR
ncbi:hypothetical protein NDU88_009232 [Pleurodeles waltl]|uniref:Uncharacterized protein n=1 Tax=Pleurodeles waltl TaxID=8319 RepID=A0AAV7P1Q6_PLEWA|nr:hypothetical protein NDU88_009232 [Pleurodeles waltl]